MKFVIRNSNGGHAFSRQGGQSGNGMHAAILKREGKTELKNGLWGKIKSWKRKVIVYMGRENAPLVSHNFEIC